MNAPDPLAMPDDGGAPPGYRLGNFELQTVVVRHATGVVYRAWDHNLGIPVAIKEYLPLRLARRKPDGDIEPLDADTIDAFERGRHAFVDEARLLARCDHPSLLRVRQLLQAHGTAYRVMPWYVGRTLLDVRREMAGPPDEPALRALLADLLGALESWHRVGGLHGGVNPAQILLLDDDRALLLGPGAARRATAVDAVESLMRQLEPGFAAPEQLVPADQAPAGPWTDFYALARVVRFCISGMLPPPSAAPVSEPLQATVDKLYFDAPGVQYSGHFLATLDAAAAAQIDQRPQTVAEFSRWLDEGPVARGAPAAMERAPQATPAGVIPAPPQPAGAAVATPAASTAADEEAVDAQTMDLIQRVIESIPPSPPAPVQAAQPAGRVHGAPPEPAWQADRDMELPFTTLPRHQRPLQALWLLLIVALLAFIGYAAWELRYGPPRQQALPPAAVTPPAPVVAPAPPPADTRPPVDRPVEAAPPVVAADPVPTPPAGRDAVAAPADSPTSRSAAVARAGPDNPRAVCGDRTPFSLYRCMQQQCATDTWAGHAQCVRLKATDSVD